MSDPTAPAPDIARRAYHVLLIGLNQYPAGYNSLFGCVNDIDAIQSLLLDPPGIGVPRDRIHLARLAAPREDTPDPAHPASPLPPSKENVVAAIEALIGQVQPGDSVLIYYSGHGDQEQLTDPPGWHESIVPADAFAINRLYDVEMNGLIERLGQKLSGGDPAQRPADLTIVLDSCHSAGATRDLGDGAPLGQERFLQRTDGQAAPPGAGPERRLMGAVSAPAGAPLLHNLEPNYIAIVGCQADERSQEGPIIANTPHGVLTWSLLTTIQPLSAATRATLRWADIWGRVLDKATAGCMLLRRPVQHPWIIGRSERLVFGGPADRYDPGWRVSGPARDGTYTIAAGTVMGITEGAVVAVYGKTPALFPPLRKPDGSSNSDGQVMQLTVGPQPGRAECTATWTGGATRDVPAGARARLVAAGKDARLRVALTAPTPALRAALNAADGGSPLLEVVALDDQPEVRVDSAPDGGWVIWNDLKTDIPLATVPGGEVFAMRAGLESYAKAIAVLRLSRTLTDPALDKTVTLTLLNADDAARLAAATDAQPSLDPLGRDAEGIYSAAAGVHFVIQIASTYRDPLYVTLFDFGSGGAVPLLGHDVLHQGESKLVWRANVIGSTFETWPDDPRGGTDRLVAVATNLPNVDLSRMQVEQTVQQVIDENIGARSVLGANRGTGATELWTAVTVPLRIGPAPH